MRVYVANRNPYILFTAVRFFESSICGKNGLSISHLMFAKCNIGLIIIFNKLILNNCMPIKIPNKLLVFFSYHALSIITKIVTGKSAIL